MKVFDIPCPKCGSPLRYHEKCTYCDYDPDTQHDEADDAPASDESATPLADPDQRVTRHEPDEESERRATE